MDQATRVAPGGRAEAGPVEAGGAAGDPWSGGLPPALLESPAASRYAVSLCGHPGAASCVLEADDRA